MAVPTRHLFKQGPVIATLVKTLSSSVVRKVRGQEGSAPTAPGPVHRRTVGPRDRRLVRDHIRHLGGDPSWYRGTLPAHLSPQWGFPLLARTLADVPWDLTKILNAGARLEMRAPLPDDEPLELEAYLAQVDDDGRRVLLTERLVTGTASAPEALVTEVTAIVPLARSKKGKKKNRPRVPEKAREIDRWTLPARAGLDFALTTGDFNPIHWSAPYARLFGFRSRILHGFAAMARAMESFNRNLLYGRVEKLTSIEARFVRPLALPARPGVYVDGQGGVTVGDVPGGRAYLTGTYTTR